MTLLNRNFQKKGLNPYSDEFSIDKAEQEINKNTEIEDDSKTVILCLLKCFNESYQGYFKSLKSICEKSKTILLSKCFEYCNKIFIEKINNIYLLDKNITLNDFRNITFKFNEDEDNVTNLQTYLETMIEALNVIVRHSFYYQDNPDTVSIFNVNELFIHTSHYLLLKEIFEMMLWEDYDMRIENNNISFYFLNDLQNKLIFANRTRFDDAVIGNSLTLENLLKEKYKLGPINQLDIINGEIKVSMDITGELRTSNWLNNLSFIITFYYYIDKILLNKNINILLKDIIFVFSVIQDYFELIIKEIHIKKITNTPYRILLSDLISDISSISKFKEDIVESVISLLNYQGVKKDFWRYPLILKDKYVYFANINLIGSIVPIMIDNWLDITEFPLTNRGKIFENYIKKEITDHCEKKLFFYKIIDQKKFIVSKKEFEEIDLIVEFNDLIIIGELKCIPHPMKRIDYHDVINKIKEAKNQIIRKKNFLEKHLEKFVNLFTNSKKKIIPIVVTNLPILSGDYSENVAVIDTLLLINWLSGELQDVAFDGYSDEISCNKIYYKDENEFNKNFEEFLIKPNPVFNILNSLKTEFIPISPCNDQFNFYIESVYDEDPLNRFKSIAKE